MKGNAEVIKVLNEVLRKELTGINQYFIHSKMCKNWGYEVLAEVAWKESIEEMKHADQIIERILFLEGIPNLTAYDKINVGSSVKQQLENDLGLEEGALLVLKGGIKNCFDAGDNASRELLEHIRRSMSTGSKLSFTRLKRLGIRITWRSRFTKRANPTITEIRVSGSRDPFSGLPEVVVRPSAPSSLSFQD
jgi:bacterioferritin